MTEHLTAAQVQTIDDAGIARLYLPEELGGEEVDPVAFNRAVRELARQDGSVGWVAMNWGSYPALAGYIEAAAAREVWDGSGRTPRLAGSTNPSGRARPADGGFVVDGRWSYASGIEQADWVLANCTVEGGGTRLVMVPKAEVTVHENWDVGGLRATASHDFTVEGAFVPAARTIEGFAAPPVQRGWLYRCPFVTLFAASVPAPALGIARHALDIVTELAATKTATGATAPLLDDPRVQARLAEAEAALRAATRYLDGTLADLGVALQAGEAVTMAQRAEVRMAGAHAAATAVAAVQAAYRIGGATANFTSSGLEGCLRDVNACAQHIAVNERNFELCGRVLLGLDPGTARF